MEPSSAAVMRCSPLSSKQSEVKYAPAETLSRKAFDGLKEDCEHMEEGSGREQCNMREYARACTERYAAVVAIDALFQPELWTGQSRPDNVVFLRLTMICGVRASMLDDELEVEAVMIARSAELPTGPRPATEKERASRGVELAGAPTVSIN